MKIVIIAAGMGSRLWHITDKRPKSLLPLRGKSILANIVDNFSRIGLHDFVFVLGFEKESLADHIKKLSIHGSVSIVENEEWEKGNGLSVLTAKSAVGQEPFILSMSDHYVTPSALQSVKDSPLKGNLLLVDPCPEKVFDIDDATKVQTSQNQIQAIGKELAHYNGIDCGIFRLDHRFFSAMESALANGEDSISAGVKRLIQQKIFQPVYLQEGQTWLDIDTPEAYNEAKRRYE